eukprot:1629685-Rhodomonas_salina.1
MAERGEGGRPCAGNERSVQIPGPELERLLGLNSCRSLEYPSTSAIRNGVTIESTGRIFAGKRVNSPSPPKT